MTKKEFNDTLTKTEPPAEMEGHLKALWWDVKGNWHRAHEESQAAKSQPGDRVHAYLHRKEPDESNARHWYKRAEEPYFEGTFEEELEMLEERYLHE